MKKYNGAKENIFKLRMEGLTFKDIGSRFGISRQRVHQITKNCEKSLNIPERLKWRQFLTNQWAKSVGFKKLTTNSPQPPAEIKKQNTAELCKFCGKNEKKFGDYCSHDCWDKDFQKQHYPQTYAFNNWYL